MDAGEAGGWHYLVSRFVRGESLADRLERLTRLDLLDTLRVARHVAAGLDALHRAGLLHRDVKPSNILLDEAGAAALTDFGLVKSREFSVLTTPGQVLGTVDYLAPELIRGETATSAADVYALGCVMYECLAGTAPFARHSVLTVARAHLDEAPPTLASVRTDLPMQLPVAINAALAKDPRRRPPTALAYASMLEVAARG
jgi:serine/threonine-protein kinase